MTKKPLTLDDLSSDTSGHLKLWLTSAECDLICECLQIGADELSRLADYVRRSGGQGSTSMSQSASSKSIAARTLALKIEAQK